MSYLGNPAPLKAGHTLEIFQRAWVFPIAGCTYRPLGPLKGKMRWGAEESDPEVVILLPQRGCLTSVRRISFYFSAEEDDWSMMGRQKDRKEQDVT